MTHPPARSYYDGRLDIAALRGEVTSLAGELKRGPGMTPRDEAVTRLCGALDEAAGWLRDTLDMTTEERAALVAEIETASERLFQLEVGGP